MEAERVSLSEAARQIGVNKSTLSRWCKAHAALKDDDGRVSVAELIAHRDQVVNPRLQTRGPAAVKADPIPAPQGPSLNDARNRTENAKAEIAELDLLERLGRTLDRDQVEQAVAAAADKLRSAAAAAVKDHAERLANIEDVRAMEVALRDMMDGLMDTAAEALCAAGGGTAPDSDTDEGEASHAA